MPLFGPLHLTLIAIIVAACAILSIACRRKLVDRRVTRLTLGWALVINELIWWDFRYSHEGLHLWNLPLQLCDVTLWMSALACVSLFAPVIEFAYFGGLARAGMAILTPDLWSPWPSYYPAIYFFLARLAALPPPPGPYGRTSRPAQAEHKPAPRPKRVAESKANSCVAPVR